MAYDIAYKKDLKLHVQKFLLYPNHWEDKANFFPYKLKWRSCKFTKGNRVNVPSDMGVYCFVIVAKVPNFISTRYLMYVGQTKRTLATRYGEYLVDQSGKGKARHKVEEMLDLYKKHLYFYFAAVNSGNRIDEIEEKLINTFVPPVNSDIPKAKIKPELKYIYS